MLSAVRDDTFGSFSFLPRRLLRLKALSLPQSHDCVQEFSFSLHFPLLKKGGIERDFFSRNSKKIPPRSLCQREECQDDMAQIFSELQTCRLRFCTRQIRA